MVVSIKVFIFRSPINTAGYAEKRELLLAANFAPEFTI